MTQPQPGEGEETPRVNIVTPQVQVNGGAAAQEVTRQYKTTALGNVCCKVDVVGSEDEV